MTDDRAGNPITVAPISDAHWPTDLKGEGLAFAKGLNVYRTMAHHPALLRAWADLREHVVKQSTLGPEALEVVILRAAHRLGSAYEWSQHVLRGRAAGLSDTRIRACSGDIHGMTSEDGLLCQAVDELMTGASLTPDTRARLIDAKGLPAVFDLMATVGFYSTLGFILKTFDTPLDDPVQAALNAEPLG